jgi:DNA invertase Pin-like site-specific DNA recombinase
MMGEAVVLGQEARMKQAFGYVRVSTEEQAREGLSLDAQREQLASYAQMRGLELVEVIADEGVSAGKPIHTRPAGARLIERLERGEASAVIAYKLDRLFRHTLDCLQVIERWHERGVALHLVDMGGQAIDTSSAMGRFFLTVMAGVAEMERNLIRERITLAMRYKVDRGEFTGVAPLGFRPDADNKLLIADDAEQAVVAHILALRAQGRSIRAITAALNEDGWPARGKRWHKTSVERLLRRMKDKASG